MTESDMQTEFREHAADTLARAIGPDRSICEFHRETGIVQKWLRDLLSGNQNMRINSLSRVAFAAGYKLRLVLEPIEDTE